MARLLAAAVILWMVSPVAGDVVPYVTPPRYEGHVMSFDLCVYDLGYVTTEAAVAFGARALLSGSDASRFTGYPDPVDSLAGSDLAALLAPQTYAWETFRALSLADAGADAGRPWMAFGVQQLQPAETVPVRDLERGTILARFYFLDSRPGDGLTDLYLQIQSYAGVSPYAIIGLDQDPWEMHVSVLWGEPFRFVPEPAALSLLSVGLALLLRRRRP